MSNGYKIEDKDGLYYLTFQIVGWVDVFTRKIYKDIVTESFAYCQKHKGLELFAYVIMSNHIHLLARSNTGDLSGTICDFKNNTSKKFLETIKNGPESRNDWMKMVFEYHGKFKNKQTYQIWTYENHAELIYSQKFIEQKLDYIHNNPVRAGIVAKAEDCIYSSARNYADIEGFIDVIKLDCRWEKL